MSRSKYQQRAERILDAAAELVLRWGSKRVTMEEVAKLAGIGKGTVYLHFRTREALFMAMLVRDSLCLMDEYIEAIRQDPAELLPHRQARRAYLGVMGRPLLRAMFSRDGETLGALAHETALRPVADAKLEFSAELLGLLREHGLVRTDLDLRRQQYAMAGMQTGFYLLDPQIFGEPEFDLTAQADTLSQLVRLAIELPGPPDTDVLCALAPKAVAMFEQMRAALTAVAHGDPPKGE